MPGMALGTTTIENIVAHDAAALEKDLASIRSDAAVTLPGVPQIVTRLQQMLSDPEVGIPQLVPVINYEPVLVGRVLQMANSAALNPTRRQITDIRTGVTRVGFDLLRSAALAYALRQVSQAHSVKDVRAHLEGLWERSAWTAAVSFVIARKFTRVNRDIAFLCGLMIRQALSLLPRARLFADVRGNPVAANVEAGLKAYHAGAHDGVIAFGGGSGLDAGKVIAFMAYKSGLIKPTENFKLGVVAATGGIALLYLVSMSTRSSGTWRRI